MKKYLGIKYVDAELVSGKERYGFDKPNNAISQHELDSEFYKVHRDGRFCWKRKEDFEKDYQPIDWTIDMEFGYALTALRNGLRISRRGWNSKGMWIELRIPDLTSKMTRPYLYHVAPKGTTNHYGDNVHDFERVPWLPSNTDILASDWFVVDD